MRLSAEISMYPFKEDYLTPIQQYIDKLNQYPGLTVTTSATATLVSGDYQEVLSVIGDSMAWSYQNFGRAVFVTKFIPGGV